MHHREKEDSEFLLEVRLCVEPVLTADILRTQLSVSQIDSKLYGVETDKEGEAPSLQKFGLFGIVEICIMW